ncbi:MAG: Do family serine endopeptidase [Candidatus Aminicenantales bacterium]
MKKYAWIAVSSFALGLLLAGYVFLYLPEKNAAPGNVFAKAAAPDPAAASNLFASSLPQEKAPMDFVTIAEKIGPAVVRIEADRRQATPSQGLGGDWPFGDDFFNRMLPQPRQSQPEAVVQVGGTGFFISADGYILTNNHMVEKDKTTRVTVTTTAGDDYDAKIIGTDPSTDLALLKINAKNMPFAELGDSGQVKVGEWVLAIGNPLGMDNTVTAGIVSYKGRSIDTQSYQDFIQTDAAINRGNSGGPLLNMKGEVIGITSSILTSGFAGSGGSIGIGFAIPSNIARKVVVELKEKGRVIRGRLGVQIRDLSEGMVKQWNLKSKAGAVVISIEPDSPAEKAKMKQYDVITQVNGEPVKNGDELRFKIADIKPGNKVDLTVVRDGKEMRVTAIVDELEPVTEKGQIASSEKDIGVSVIALTPSIARRYGVRTTEGLLITDVRQGSEADRENLVAGMIILEVNRKKMASVGDFDDILKKTASGDEVILLVRRETDGSSQDFIATVKVR